MSRKDIFGDEVQKNPNNHTEAEDFASLFAQSEGSGLRKLRNGDQFSGEILSLNSETVFVSTGTPVDGNLPTTEILDSEKKPKFKVGDKIDVLVVRVKGDEVLLRYKGAKGASQDVDSLEDAFDMELPLEGKVLESVKGGFRVQLQGQKAFCPLSQIDFRIASDINQYVGNKYEFLITQFENDGRNIVVSRKKLLSLNKAEAEGTFLLKHKLGDILDGTVQKIEKFGAFIELEGGVESLCHISEIGWSRIQDPHEVLRIGQSVRVKLLKLEEQESKLRISVSIKQGGGESDPWLTVLQNFPVGTTVEGTIEKKEVFGFFVQISPGITGLLPKSKIKEDVMGHDYELKKRGDKIKVQVDQVNFEDRKVSLRIPLAYEDESWRGQNIENSKGFGSLADAFNRLKR